MLAVLLLLVGSACSSTPPPAEKDCEEAYRKAMEAIPAKEAWLRENQFDRHIVERLMRREAWRAESRRQQCLKSREKQQQA